MYQATMTVCDHSSFTTSSLGKISDGLGSVAVACQLEFLAVAGHSGSMLHAVLFSCRFPILS
jgi:hypothetical protein